MPMLDCNDLRHAWDKYLLQANDRIDFYYVNCPTESGDHELDREHRKTSGAHLHG